MEQIVLEKRGDLNFFSYPGQHKNITEVNVT